MASERTDQPCNGTDTPRLLSIKRVAAQLSISTTRVRQLIRDGEIGSVRIGYRILVPVRALEEYVAQLEQEAQAEAARQRFPTARSIQQHVRHLKVDGGLRTDGRRGGRKNG